MPPGKDKNQKSPMLVSTSKDFRQALVRGEMSEAETISDLIMDLLTNHLNRPEDEIEAQRDVHRLMLEGIGATLAGDNRTGTTSLHRITRAKKVDDALVWTAWLWICRAAQNSGDLKAAKAAAKKVMDISTNLDVQAKSTSFAALGELEALEGDTDKALNHLSLAQDLFGEINDTRGKAHSLLAKARVMVTAGQELESIYAAQEAVAEDPTWLEPVLFLVQQSLKDGDLDHASEVLEALGSQKTCPPNVERERKLLQLVREEKVPLWVVNEYIRLRESLPSKEIVNELEAMIIYSPQFHYLREELAWKLLKLGMYEEASTHFQVLAKRDLEVNLRSSVLAGLGCLASVTRRNKHPSVRLHAAVAAVPEKAFQEDQETRTVETEAVDVDAPATVTARPRRESRPVDLRRAMEAITNQKAVFSGDIQILAFPNLLEFLRSGRRTGTLVISSETGIGAIYLRKGMITGAASPKCANIGRLLISDGTLTKEALEQAAAAQKETPEKLLGAILVEQGHVPHDVMKEALTDQIYKAIREIYQWIEGTFAFSPDTAGYDLPSEVEVDLDPQHVLMDVLSQLDDEES